MTLFILAEVEWCHVKTLTRSLESITLSSSEINSIQRGDGGGGGRDGDRMRDKDPGRKQMEKLYIPFEDQRRVRDRGG